MDFAVGDKFLRQGEAKNCARVCSMRASVQRFRANKDTRETRVWWIASDTRFARLTPSPPRKGSLMNSIVYIVGAVVIVVAILSFFGLR